MSDPILEEIRGVLDEKPGKPPKAPPTTEMMEDPADEALKLLKTHKNLARVIQKKVDAVSASMGSANSQAVRSGKFGGAALAALDLIEGGPLSALKDLRNVVGEAVRHIDNVVKRGSRGRGSLGYHHEDRMAFVDEQLQELAEGRQPNVDPPPHNATTNNYAPELAAAMADAKKSIGAIRALTIGQNIYIGRKSLQVVNTPTQRGAEWFVTLSGPTSAGFQGTPEAFTLVVPTDSKAGTTQKTMAELRHGEHTMELYLSDIRLDEDEFGQHFTNYGDYGPAMGRIKPGDAVNLTKTVFRVIGKSGNSALIQPDATYGDFKAAMGKLPASDLAQWQGGVHFRDTNTSAPKATLKNPSGRTSLVGLSVLNYNPHNGQFSWPSGTMPGEYKQATAITIVGHDKALGKVVGEDVTPERFDMMIDEAEGDNLMAKLSTVAEGEDMLTVNGVLVDPYTAQLALQVYEGLKTENQGRMEAMTVYEVIATTHRMFAEVSEEN